MGDGTSAAPAASSASGVAAPARRPASQTPASAADIAQGIVEAVGGTSNITDLTHCATRLHMALADPGRTNPGRIEAVSGVLGAFPRAGGRYQIIIGGAVASVYERIMGLRATVSGGEPSGAGSVDEVTGVVAGDGGQSRTGAVPSGTPGNARLDESAVSVAGTDAVASPHSAGHCNSPAGTEAFSAAFALSGRNDLPRLPRTARDWAEAILDYLSDSFRPLLGVLLGASLVIAIANVVIALGLMPSGGDASGWKLLRTIWEGMFTLLPIMIAYNAARRLHVDPWLGGSIMAALMIPQFTGLSGSVSVFGVRVTLSDYSGNIFVPLLMVAVLALVYHGLTRIIPGSVQMVFVPFLSLSVVYLIALLAIGPFGIWMGDGLAVATAWLDAHVPFLFALVIPMLYPFLVPLGLHWPLNALMLMNLQSLGYDFVQGPMGVWNFACFGATAGVLVLAVRERDSAMRQTALGALVAGLLGGVSELSLYGIHLRHRRVYRWLLAGCAAGGVASAVLGWLFPSVLASGRVIRGVTTTAFAFSSLLTIPVFSRMWVYALSIVVAFATAMTLTVLFGYRTPVPDESADDAETTPVPSSENAVGRGKHGAGSDDAVAGPVPADKDDFVSQSATCIASDHTAPDVGVSSNAIFAPVSGRVEDLGATGDPVFESRALGEGVCIVPATSTMVPVLAPVSGTLKTVAKTGHAFGIKTDGGVEVLVHIGLGTAGMDGEGFAVDAAKGDRVDAGRTLARVDFGAIAAAGHDTAVVVTVVNTAAMTSVTPLTGRHVTAGDPIIDVER
ncbi:PTS glucose transporter subunit IIA [Bifidobacterium sp. SO4]|nr:glucose PTS transporter subunit IIA [Bifidobacterium sp. SO4]MBT1170862.1 PTS glucose transporter subunit IIA [Bifidobacterium sp. SO4]